MFLGSVALMFLQSVVGVKHGELHHGAVTGNLGDDGGGGDGGATGVAIDDGHLRTTQTGPLVAVDEAEFGLALETRDGAAHGKQAGPENIVEFDLFQRGDANGPMHFGMAAKEMTQLLAIFPEQKL
jgi:hypothetical protein